MNAAIITNGIAGILYRTIAPIIGVVKPIIKNRIMENVKQNITNFHSRAPTRFPKNHDNIRIPIMKKFSNKGGMNRIPLISFGHGRVNEFNKAFGVALINDQRFGSK